MEGSFVDCSAVILLEKDDSIEKLRVSVSEEEKRLENLEKERIALQNEIDSLEKEIIEEKRKYRKLLDNILFKDFDEIVENYVVKYEEPPAEASKESNIEFVDVSKFDDELKELNISKKLDTVPKTSKDEYMNSIKNFLSEKAGNK